MVRIGPLSEDKRKVLRGLRRRAVSRVAERAQMVLLSARGYAVPQIAEIFEVGEDTVRTWLHRSQERGPDGLVDWPRPGRRPKDCLARQIVDTQMHNSPRANGLVQACWTVGLLAAFLAARFRLALSARTIRRHLHASGWRWARPRLDVATHAPRGQRPVARQHRGAGQRGRALLHYPSLPGPASAHCGSSVTRPGCLRSMPFLHLRA